MYQRCESSARHNGTTSVDVLKRRLDAVLVSS